MSGPLVDPLLTVVIPVFDEAPTLAEIVRRVRAQPWRKQVVLVDDGSADGSLDLCRALADTHADVEVVVLPANRGKGAALRAGFAVARGALVVVQDADLEYDPADWGALLAPLLDGRADVVFGSRFLGGTRRTQRVDRYLANRALTALSNHCTRLALTDMETCYKAFRREVLDGMELREDRFGFEPEFTARVAAGGFRVCEVPVSYAGRDHAQGKKIGWRDGVHAVRVILRGRWEARSGARPRVGSGGPPHSGARVE
jgi:glycosyltransferase involved in cell wall biosynthesis